MFTFRCQGCGKQHVVDRPFEQDYATKCLRCGERVRVTRATIHVAAGGAATGAASADDSITARLPAAAPGGAAVADAAPVVAGESATGGAGGGDDYEPPEGEVPLAELDPDGAAEGGQGTRPRPAKGRRNGGGGKSAGGARGDSADEADEPSDAEDAPAEKRRRDPPEPPADASFWGRLKLRERWPLVAGAAVLLLGLIGGGCYLLFSGKKPPEKKEVATKPKPPSKPAAPPATQKAPEKPAPPPLVTKTPEVSIAATRLSAELAADAAAANAKYKDKWIEVSGLFDKVDQRQAGPPPARSHAFFAAEGGPAVSCDLVGSLTEANRWKRIPQGQPFTARGTYRADGVLTGCELVPLAAPADARYKGQPVEITGAVESLILPDRRQPFPGLRLERDVDAIAQLECYFRADALDEVNRLQPTDLVTVRGTCGGRGTKPGDYTIRMDNCELVYTSAPAAPAVRRDVVAFLREYEEDLRPFYLPAPGAEPRVEETLSLSRLNRELAGDAAAAAAKYGNKLVTVSGKLLQRGDREVILHSGNTDEPLRVACSFNRVNFEDVNPRLDQVIRGRWVGMDDKMLRLVCCESADPNAPRDPRRITPDHLPHVADRQLTYDVAEYPFAPRKDGPVVRVVQFQREGERTETVVTHTGQLVGKSLFEDGAAKWVEQKKTTREVRVAGPTYRQRIVGTFIEVGTTVLKDRREDVVWDKVLKVGARTGDSWKWTRAGATHEFTVERFDEEGGRSRVVVKEVISSPLDLHNRIEKQHVYAREVGEVEEHEWKLIGATQRLLMGEKKLVESAAGDKAPAQAKPDFVGPPRPDYVPAGPPAPPH